MQSSDKIQPLDPYEALGLPSGASEQAVKQAYDELMIVYSPDKKPCGDSNEATDEIYENINYAYRLITAKIDPSNQPRMFRKHVVKEMKAKSTNFEGIVSSLLFEDQFKF